MPAVKRITHEIERPRRFGSARKSSGDAVRVGLVVAAMPCVFLAGAQQHLMQLLDVVLGKRDVLPRREHLVHHLGIASHFLLVAGVERFDLQVG